MEKAEAESKELSDHSPENQIDGVISDLDEVELLPSAMRKPGPKDRRVLLVDDSTITFRLMRSLIDRAGYYCDVATNGLEAVEMTKKATYHMIFMDIQMPVMNGIDATEIIREDEQDLGEPYKLIYALTSSCEKDDLVSYNDVGMDGCIQKGCIFVDAVHEAISVSKDNPNDFVFINNRNAASIIPRTSVPPASDITLFHLNEPNSPLDHRPDDPSSDSHSPSSRDRPVALLVDDIKITQKITSRALDKAGYSSVIAYDGETAVSQAAEQNFSVILMDVNLPGIDGCEATQQIRTLEKKKSWRPATIFGLTATCGDAELLRCEHSGMDGCIEKGCVVPRAVEEALCKHYQHPEKFVFIDSKNLIHLRDRIEQ